MLFTLFSKQKGQIINPTFSNEKKYLTQHLSEETIGVCFACTYVKSKSNSLNRILCEK